ncbi:MAG: hypothetical protein AAF266_00375 [Planctomycetota bacterium]
MGGRYDLDWFGLFSTGSFAFVAGLLRERFNHLLPGIALHAAWMTYLVGFDPNTTGTIAFYIAVAIAFGLAFHFVGDETTELSGPGLP